MQDHVFSDSGRMLAEEFLKNCCQHGRLMLESQLSDLHNANMDFSSTFERMGKEFFMVGAMMRYAEQYPFPTDARERAFLCLIEILVSDGLSFSKARARVSWMLDHSRNKLGEDNLFILAGYQSEPEDGSLRMAFERFVDEVELSGKSERILNKFRNLAMCSGVGAGTIFSIAIAARLQGGDAWYYVMIVLAFVGGFFTSGFAVLLLGAGFHRYKIRR